MGILRIKEVVGHYDAFVCVVMYHALYIIRFNHKAKGLLANEYDNFWIVLTNFISDWQGIVNCCGVLVYGGFGCLRMLSSLNVAVE